MIPHASSVCLPALTHLAFNLHLAESVVFASAFGKRVTHVDIHFIAAQKKRTAEEWASVLHPSKSLRVLHDRPTIALWRAIPPAVQKVACTGTAMQVQVQEVYQRSLHLLWDDAWLPELQVIELARIHRTDSDPAFQGIDRVQKGMERANRMGRPLCQTMWQAFEQSLNIVRSTETSVEADGSGSEERCPMALG